LDFCLAGVLAAICGDASADRASTPARQKSKLQALKPNAKDPNAHSIAAHISAGDIQVYYDAFEEKHGLVSVLNHFPGLTIDESEVGIFTVALSTEPYEDEVYTTPQGGSRLRLNTLAATNSASLTAFVEGQLSMVAPMIIDQFKRGTLFVTMVATGGFEAYTEESYTLAVASCLIGAPLDALLTGLVEISRVEEPGGIVAKTKAAISIGKPLITGDLTSISKDNKMVNNNLAVSGRRVDKSRPIYEIFDLSDLYTVCSFVNQRYAAVKENVAVPNVGGQSAKEHRIIEIPIDTNMEPLVVNLGDPTSLGLPRGTKSEHVLATVEDADELLRLMQKNSSKKPFNFSPKNFVKKLSVNPDGELIGPGTVNRKVVQYQMAWDPRLENTLKALMTGLRESVANDRKTKGTGAQHGRTTQAGQLVSNKQRMQQRFENLDEFF